MRNIIFLSANYEYTCLVAKQFAEQKNLDFMDINYYVETKLAKNLEKQSALSKYTEQLVLDALQKQNKVFAMDIVYLACKKIKDFCFEGQYLVYLAVEKERRTYPYSIAGDELEKHFISKADFVINENDIPNMLELINFKE